MIDGTVVSGKRRSTLLILIVGATLIAAAQTQAQQPAYPGQSYPTPPPAYMECFHQRQGELIADGRLLAVDGRFPSAREAIASLVLA